MRIPAPEIGQTRRNAGFLWTQKRINGEMRWLENAAWEEQLFEDYYGNVGWVPMRWLDDSADDVPLEADGLRPITDNAFALALGCGCICIALTVLGLIAWGLVVLL
jgi:hypothetical protein